MEGSLNCKLYFAEQSGGDVCTWYKGTTMDAKSSKIIKMPESFVKTQSPGTNPSGKPFKV
jgi:hypothetical protein